MKRPFPQRVRRAWRELTGKRSEDYAGGAMNRLLADWLAWTRSADEELKGSLRKVRARARDLARNQGWAKQFLRILTTNIIGPDSIALQVRIRRGEELDKALNDAIEMAWWRWTRRAVTVDGRLNLRRLQVQLIRAMARDGEVFVRRWKGYRGNPFRYALQPIDADMLDESFNRAAKDGGNEIRMGIEIDAVGAPVAYHFWEREPDPGVGGGKRIRVSAEEVLHLYDPERVNQNRGVSWLHPSMVPLKMLDGYEEAELVASRTAAAKMGFFTAPEGTPAPNNTGPATMEASPGSLEQLPPGWTFNSWDPQHPVASFGSFVKTALRKIASGLGISYNSLANDLEGVNYSSMRSGLLIERDFAKTLQQDWIDLFLTPVFEDWIALAVLSGQLRVPDSDPTPYLDAIIWQPRGWQWVDPLKDVAAAEKAITLGVSTRHKECAERGLDFGEVVRELALERKMLEEAGLRTADAGGTDVDPDDFNDDPSDGSSNGNGDGRAAGWERRVTGGLVR